MCDGHGVDEQRLRQLQADWWTLAHGWDDGRAGELVAAIPDLVAEVRALRQQVKEARTWAWSEHHQSFSDRWLGPRSGTKDEWRLPDWLASPYEPYRQPWWDEPDPVWAAASSGAPAERDPADVVADAVRQVGRLGVLEDPAGVREAALAAVERLRRQRDNAQGEAQHWLDMYTVRLTAENPGDTGPATGSSGDHATRAGYGPEGEQDDE